MDNSRYAGYVSDCSADFMAYRSSDEMYKMLPAYQRKFNIPIMSIILDDDEKSGELKIPYEYDIEADKERSLTLGRDEIYHNEGEGNLYVYSSLHYCNCGS